MTSAARIDRPAAVLRVLRGEELVAVAADLGVAADSLAVWRDNFIAGGSEALTDSDVRPVVQRSVALSDVVGDEPHPDHFVWWDSISDDDVLAFKATLDTARREEDVQAYLAANPLMLVQPLGGGHGRWVLPKKRLGAEYVTDFVVGDKDSSGYNWIAVELESPKAELFTKRGDETAALRHAIRQVEEWRVWLTNNQPYARASRDDGGLDLPDINPQLQGWVVIGRRSIETSDRFNGRRRYWAQTNNIEVHTYDWLLERAQGRLAELDRWHRRRVERPEAT